LIRSNSAIQQGTSKIKYLLSKRMILN